MRKPYAIGIDVGGTKIAAGLVDRNGQVLHRFSTRAHAEQLPEFVIATIEQAYQAVVQNSGVDPAQIEAVGLGFPGNTNSKTGMVLFSSNLPEWDHFPLRDTVAKRIGTPVVLENDANLAALGEHRFGVGRGTQHMCYVTFSTGYGIGIILNGEPYVGHIGSAGELGHVVININGPLCTCGKRGCIMAYASGIGISRMVYEKIATGVPTMLLDRLAPDGQRVNAEIVATAAKQGDTVAQEILRTAGYYAGVGLSMIIQILNPELIVVGGGLVRIGSLVWEPALAAMREHTQPELWDSVRIVPWQLEDDLGILGAAAKAFA